MKYLSRTLLYYYVNVYLVCPTKDKTKVLSTFFGSPILNAQIPLIPGRSMDACSWIPIPFLMILNDPSLYAPTLEYYKLLFNFSNIIIPETATYYVT